MQKKIVIIDDDSDMRLYYITVLGDLNLKITEAENGEEGIKKINEEKPDLVLLDLLMPKNGGLSVFNKIMDDPELNNIPVVIISAATSVTGVDMKYYVFNRPFKERKKNIPDKRIETRPIEYLEKPVKPEDLLNIVKKVLAL
jgi:CheY-like chemotaxis protein